MADSEKELMSLLMRVIEASEKPGLKLSIQKINIMVPGPITSLQRRGKSRISNRFYFPGLQNSEINRRSHEINRRLLLGRTFLVAQRLKCLTPMQETWVRSLGREDPLEKEMTTHSSILAWRISWTEEPGGLQSTGSRRVGHD